MGRRRLPEVGRPGQDVSVLEGDDVDPTTGRLLTVAELQAALRAAIVVRQQRQAHHYPGTTIVGRSSPAQPEPVIEPMVAVPGLNSDDEASTALLGSGDKQTGQDDAAVDQQSATAAREGWRSRWSIARTASDDVHRGPGDGSAVGDRTRMAPAGFVGADAAAGWSWLTAAHPPRLLVCSAPGVGVEGTRISALLAGVLGAARPTLAIDIGRGMAASLTQLVCGTTAEQVSAIDWLPEDSTQEPDLTVLPAGPSGTRVVQTGTPLWGRVVPRIPHGLATITDLGLVDYDDVRQVLVGHDGPAVMVARADSDGVRAALAAMTDLDAEGLVRRPLLVLADGEGARPAALRAAQRLAQAAIGDGVVVVPKSRDLRACPIPASSWRKDLAGAVTALVAALAQRERAPLSRPA